MLRPLLLLTLLAWTQAAPCIETPRIFSEASSGTKDIEQIEACCGLGAAAFFTRWYSNPSTSTRKDFHTALAMASFACAFLECFKVILLTACHGGELQGWCTQTPVDAVYKAIITVELTTTSEVPVPNNTTTNETFDLTETISVVSLTERKIFENKSPLALLTEINQFIHTWGQKHKKNEAILKVTVDPSVTTARGKTITLDSFSPDWYERDGIEEQLRKAFFIPHGRTLSQKANRATFFTLLNSTICVFALYMLAKSEGRVC